MLGWSSVDLGLVNKARVALRRLLLGNIIFEHATTEAGEQLRARTARLLDLRRRGKGSRRSVGRSPTAKNCPSVVSRHQSKSTSQKNKSKMGSERLNWTEMRRYGGCIGTLRRRCKSSTHCAHLCHFNNQSSIPASHHGSQHPRSNRADPRGPTDRSSGHSGKISRPRKRRDEATCRCRSDWTWTL